MAEISDDKSAMRRINAGWQNGWQRHTAILFGLPDVRCLYWNLIYIRAHRFLLRELPAPLTCYFLLKNTVEFFRLPVEIAELPGKSQIEWPVRSIDPFRELCPDQDRCGSGTNEPGYQIAQQQSKGNGWVT